LDERMDGIMRVSVVATGMEAETAIRPQPMPEIAMKPLVAATPAPAAAAMPAEAPVEAPVETVAETPAEPVVAMAETAVPVDADPAMEAPAVMAEEATHVADEPDFTFSPEPPVAEETEAAAPAEEGYYSDDPNQHDLMDIVETPAAEDKEEPFILRDTVDPDETPEATAPAEAAKPAKASLMRNISRIFTGKDADEPKETPAADKRDGVTFLEPVITAPETPAQEPEAPAAETPAAEAPKTVAEMAATLAEATPAAEQPAPENQLDMTPARDDVDLEIPAFLRRQAN
ncbi:MAG: hypothetical protein ACON4P_02070, partial [Candidatus Puniceispirillales bacterium]